MPDRITIGLLRAEPRTARQMGYKIRNNVLSRRRINSAKENGNDIMTYMSLKAGATPAKISNVPYNILR